MPPDRAQPAPGPFAGTTLLHPPSPSAIAFRATSHRFSGLARASAAQPSRARNTAAMSPCR